VEAFADHMSFHSARSIPWAGREAEAPVRTIIVIAVAAAVVVTGFVVRTAFTSGSSVPSESAGRPVATATTLWPHEIHLNYKGMKDLPVHETKEPF